MFHFRHLTNNFKRRPKKNCSGKQVLVQPQAMQAHFTLPLHLWRLWKKKTVNGLQLVLFKERERDLFVPKEQLLFCCLILFPHTLSAFWLKPRGERQSEHFTPCLHKRFMLWGKSSPLSKRNYLCKKRSTWAVYYGPAILCGCTDYLQLPSSKLFTRH